MKKIVFEKLPPMPDFGLYNENNIAQIGERAVAIHNEANYCLQVVNRNIDNYIKYVQALITMVLERVITNVENEDFDTVNALYEKLVAQFEELSVRYDSLDHNFHTDAYVRVALINFDDNACLGIYNADRCAHHADSIKEEILYILESDVNEADKTMPHDPALSLNSTTIEEKVVEGFRGALEDKDEKDTDSQFQFVKSDKTFKDVAGLKEVKEDLMQIVDFIKRPQVYKDFGAKLPKGTILYGPPGTGKTLLARAVAGEADAKFIALNSTDFTASRWGEVPKMIKDLFSKARKYAPCIIFIDEIDMLGLNRGADRANSLAHRESLNAFLSAMDGFNQYEGVTVVAATNRLDDLDPAMMRPGRFDNLFAVPLPNDINEVQEVVEIYMRNKRFDAGVEARTIARKMLRQSPAAIESVLNEACLIAIKKNNGIIRECDINEAFLKKTIKGHVRGAADVSDEDSKMVAVHEAGHALIAVHEDIPVQSVTIMGTTSGAGGLTMMDPTNKHYFRKSDYEKQIKVSYGGRAAEQLAFGADMVTTGASADIRKATELIKSASANYGFNLYDSATHAPVVYKTLAQGNLEKAANKYYAEAIEILKNNIYALKAIAKELLDNGTISGDKVKEIYEKYKKNEETNVNDIEIN